jgi:hypothetical protein
MENKDPYIFISIGLGIRALMQCSGLSRGFLIKEGEKLLNNVKSTEFQVSIEAFSMLEKFINNLQVLPDEILSSSESLELSGIMQKLEIVVWSEAKTKSVFIVSEKRYSLNVLLNHPENMFTNGIFENLNNLARYDFAEGLLCIVFSRPTAASFHVLRSTEGVLKDLYFKKVIRKREKKPMWGNMVNALKKKRIDEKLLDRLDYIRENFRNPTDHPKDIYTIDEAEDIIGICTEVIGKMAEILKK